MEYIYTTPRDCAKCTRFYNDLPPIHRCDSCKRSCETPVVVVKIGRVFLRFYLKEKLRFDV